MKNTFSSTVTTYSRLHLSLHDCGYATGRIFGGVGVAFKGFPTTVVASPAADMNITFSESLSPSDRTVEGVRELADRLLPVFGPFSVEIIATAPEHMGFGSKTSLLLAITQAVAAASGKKYSPAELIELTGRGGTSGIGVNTFFQGGLIADAGHSTGEKRVFAPSSGRTAKKVPPMVAHVLMPNNWEVQLFYDPEFNPIEGEVEKKKFIELMPLPEMENLRAIATTYQGVIPAVLENDIRQLALALRTLNQTGMKRHEVAVQTQKTKKFLTDVWEAGLAAGLTSFGPTVFVVDELAGKGHKQAGELARKVGLQKLGSFAFDNQGFSDEPAVI